MPLGELSRAKFTVKVLRFLFEVGFHVKFDFSLEERSVRADVTAVVLMVEMSLLDVSIELSNHRSAYWARLLLLAGAIIVIESMCL